MIQRYLRLLSELTIGAMLTLSPSILAAENPSVAMLQVHIYAVLKTEPFNDPALGFTVERLTLSEVSDVTVLPLRSAASLANKYELRGNNFPLLSLRKGGQVVFETPFALSETWHDKVIAGERRLSLEIPAVPADKLTITSSTGVTLYQRQLSLLANCNHNGRCEVGESALFCAEDCSAAQLDGVCVLLDDKTCDPDCSSIEFGGNLDPEECRDPKVFCENGTIDEDEESIDCGGVCTRPCIYDQTLRSKLQRLHDDGKLNLEEFKATIERHYP